MWKFILLFGKYPFLLPLYFRGLYFLIPLRIGYVMFFIQGLQVHVTYTILIRSFKCACEVNLGLLYSILFHKEVKPESVLIFKSGFLNLIFKLFTSKTWYKKALNLFLLFYLFFPFCFFSFLSTTI